MPELESKVVHGKTKEELERRVNDAISGRQVTNISHSHSRDGSGVIYSATILMAKQDGTRQYLVEG